MRHPNPLPPDSPYYPSVEATLSRLRREEEAFLVRIRAIIAERSRG